MGPAAGVKRYPLTSDRPLTRREVYERTDTRLFGSKALAVLNRAFASGLLEMPAGYSGDAVVQAWHRHCQRNGHPNVMIWRRKGSASVHLRLNDFARGGWPVLRLTGQGQREVQAVMLGAMRVRGRLQGVVYTASSGGCVHLDHEDAELVARQVLDVALEHSEEVHRG